MFIMKNMWKSVNHVITKADLLIIVLDARYVSETVNDEIIGKIRSQGKPYLWCSLYLNRQQPAFPMRTIRVSLIATIPVALYGCR